MAALLLPMYLLPAVANGDSPADNLLLLSYYSTDSKNGIVYSTIELGQIPWLAYCWGLMNSETNDSDSTRNNLDSKTSPNDSKRTVNADWDSKMNPNDCNARSLMDNEVEGKPPPVGAVVGLVAIDQFGC